jgi:hypothetical protein
MRVDEFTRIQDTEIVIQAYEVAMAATDAHSDYEWTVIQGHWPETWGKSTTNVLASQVGERQ